MENPINFISFQQSSNGYVGICPSDVPRQKSKILALHEVVILDLLEAACRNFDLMKSQKFTFLPWDIRRTNTDVAIAGLLKGYKIDWIFHLAGLADVVPSINNPENYFLTNVFGTMNVLEAARKSNVKKLVYASSSSVYGIPDAF